MKKSILLLFLGITITLSAQTIKLNVPAIKKEQTEWCWAASSKCVLVYYGYWEQQCDIAEYVRNNGTLYNYGTTPCCTNASLGCNQGVSLNDIANILVNFGNIRNAQAGNPIGISEIRFHLNKQCPIIMRLEDPYDPMHGHAMVIYGIDDLGGTFIHFMDPDTGIHDINTYNNLLDYKGLQWKYSITPLTCPGKNLYPCHCYNYIKDGDEEGIDCGGSCEPCGSPPPPPPPTGNCTNCEKNAGEEEIDCGGPHCPPCKDLTEEITIEDKSYGYVYPYIEKAMATKKITAKGNTKVESGWRASFITSETGSIVLLPSFRAQEGSYFRAYTADLSEYSRICPDTLCETVSASSLVYRNRESEYSLTLYDLLYAVKIEYKIYDIEQGEYIYSNTLKITRNGKFILWDGTTGAITTQGEVAYWLFCTIYYCNGMKSSLMQRFVVKDWKMWGKSLTEEPEEPETSPLFSPPTPDDTSPSSATEPPHFSIIPNPNSGTFQLETNFPLSNIGNLKVVNLLGATVFETQNVMKNTIQLQNSAAGMFFLVIILKDGNVLTQKIVVRQ